MPLIVIDMPVHGQHLSKGPGFFGLIGDVAGSSSPGFFKKKSVSSVQTIKMVIFKESVLKHVHCSCQRPTHLQLSTIGVSFDFQVHLLIN